ncbi:GIY-YIG nuclease family protein [Alkalicoccobacillus murimartini]|uniref:GIY-YIG domain-containing protein n=1 Tax=Alkalicoccobacillus murimartini TaxID=171685 RepID=A0ABT9YP20_9BACI|nr:GIY-YIG nuclease family protein [Alkalicoccobacillus murimartini]MDQ0208947.1 hypothetical protein [Alkalicoccobacillus murimartini]
MTLKSKIDIGTEFDDIVESFPSLLEQLVDSDKHNFKALTEGYIKNVFNRRHPVAGVYIMTDAEDNPLYIGRSRNLAQRIGVDHRSTQKTQANFTHKFAKNSGLDVHAAREVLFKTLFVRFVEIEQPEARAIFEIYATMKMKTDVYNSFIEH